MGVGPMNGVLLRFRASKHLSEAVVVTGAEARVSWREKAPVRGAGAITVKGSESLGPPLR